MSNRTSAISKWWLQKRLRYNKGLLFTGLMGFVAQAAQQCFIPDMMISDLMPKMQISGTCLIVYLVLANIAFTAGSILDILFNNENSRSFRDRLFLGGYWFAVAVLTVFIIAFLHDM